MHKFIQTFQKIAAVAVVGAFAVTATLRLKSRQKPYRNRLRHRAERAMSAMRGLLISLSLGRSCAKMLLPRTHLCLKLRQRLCY